MLSQYNKPAFTFIQQLEHLKRNGLVVANEDMAIQMLSTVNYYRLSAYWHPFRKRDINNKVSSQFITNASFEEAARLYIFDQKLRSLILESLEKIEIAVRTRITYYMGHKYGAFAHTNPLNFHRKFDHSSWLEGLKKETLRSKDKFINHYKNKYLGFPDIPIWMVTEVISFGTLSFFYKGLRNDQSSGIEDKKAISKHFNLHPKRLEDWLHILTYIRNICAHHGRLWNRELAIRPDKSKQDNWLPPITPRNNRIFYILLMLKYLLMHIENNNEWALSVEKLLESIVSDDFYRESMGIPKNWQKHPLWI